MNPDKTRDKIKRIATSKFGGAQNVARDAGLNPGVLSRPLRGEGWISLPAAVAIAKSTKGVISIRDLMTITRGGNDLLAELRRDAKKTRKALAS